ncbi:uncharacterized protein N7515_009366 [Penicillium bovifimosum]|uniref:Ams2/SPT21 N-terminal domain-containing protein n=1 Tax=Penicillium bovifimosum TaxID=126998 RepID=A0A9W9GJG4_9EURO|nr:uncharacterized protein N7515_009366 [Penicillium bovifimosum]KAJ5121405.1 hypothetical protein N7515_009366 [Penicillium bovifimosum]
MDSQDGIDVRSMRLKVLYTFDNDNKTNCLARWPHVLEIQTAYLDENTPVGVIELKTCIQAIVSASPELVGQIGKDYTVYAYDYSEYETPLVGQGMLSGVLATFSSSPEAASNQSKTMITGRVCKNPLNGLFSKGAQETLEVKLRLVPVPTVSQSDLDTQSWANFVRQTPALMESSRGQSQNDHGSPMNQTGIERFHQLLSEGSTPRDFTSFHHSGSVRSVSPSQSYAGSRVSTPAYHQSYSKQTVPHGDMIRPSSSASMRDCDNQSQLSHNRRRSIQSGYDSNEEESTENPPRKRAKVYQANWPGKSNMNIERQPSSLRVAASSAASVRIHRPTPVNPALVAEHSAEEPVRPPTPISRPSDFPRRNRPAGSMLRESSTMSISSCPPSYTSPYCMSDDIPNTDATGQSPDDTRYQGLFEPSFSMPSSPPVFDSRLTNRSSPVLPTMTLDNDSGFMSTGLDDLQDDDTIMPLDDHRMAEFHGSTQGKRSVRTTVQATSPMSTISNGQGTNNDPLTIDDAPSQPASKQAPRPLSRATSRPATATGTRPSSSGAQRLAPKPLAPAPQLFPVEVPRTLRPIPASDPIVPCRPAGPMDVTFLPCTTASPSSNLSKQPAKPKQASKQAKQASKPVPKNIRARLDKAVQEGMIPPYCENCGSIETASWRRAWVRTVEGGESVAEEMMKCSSMLFWEAVNRNQKGELQRFKIFKKGLEVDDKEWSQMTFCNPCGLWLHKFRNMRPEDKWTKPGAAKPAKKDKKRPARGRATGSVDSCPATRTRSKAAPKKPLASSPAPTEASSVNPEGETPQMEEYDDAEYSPRDPRATTAELDGTEETPGRTWSKEDAREALRRAVKSSPASRAQARSTPIPDSNSLTPKPLRRSLFQNAHNEGPLKELDASAVNSCSPRRSPRIASGKGDKPVQHKENLAPTPGDDLDELFESPSIGFDSTSPTPRRRNPRINAIDKRLSLPANSPNRRKTKDLGSVMTPTRLSAERLQRIQQIHGNLQSSPRSQRSPGKQGALAPQPADDGLPEGFETIDGMILDIFDGSDKPNTFFGLENDKFGDNWAEWLPTDYVSPAGSSGSYEAPANELLNTLFSDPNDKDFNSDLLPFNFNDIVIPDSGFFSSEAHPADLSKGQSAEESSGQHVNSV